MIMKIIMIKYNERNNKWSNENEEKENENNVIMK